MTEKELKKTLISFLDAGMAAASRAEEDYTEMQKEYNSNSIEWNELSRLIKISAYTKSFIFSWLCELNFNYWDETDNEKTKD